MTGPAVKDLTLDTIVVPDGQGRPFVRARVPRITRRFSSPLHTVANVPARLSGWRTELDHFLDRRAPLARLTDDSPEPDAGAELRFAVIGALEQGYAGGVATDVSGLITARLAIPDSIAESVDLAALRHDWLWWLNAAGELTEDARTAIGWAVDELEGHAYASYLWTLPPLVVSDVAQAIRYGIVVGDDPALTCAAVLRRLTGDACYWEDGD
jgi:hypothetical protein